MRILPIDHGYTRLNIILLVPKRLLKYHFTMSITIDRVGRIVVPKALRERYGLTPGAEIEIKPMADGLHLQVRGNSPSLIERAGLLVHHGGGEVADIDPTAFINRQRIARALDSVS